ncbi:hypothetical protein L195_g039834 [Trifolium pratense]|uniref:Uncharacterized protein n=1 Tax=Trifolium pratense TaxID=57577 RepID=A0A2K3LZ29_TRIPR|nr:hypothetical protein L195_g039834 [Trifolium pratense]
MAGGGNVLARAISYLVNEVVVTGLANSFACAGFGTSLNSHACAFVRTNFCLCWFLGTSLDSHACAFVRTNVHPLGLSTAWHPLLICSSTFCQHMPADLPCSGF